MKRNNNTIKGYHINQDGTLNKSREYTWHIPKKLRKNKITPGTRVTVICGKRNKKANVIVTEAFREDIELTNKKYKPVICVR